MRSFTRITSALAACLLSLEAAALAMGPDEFAASKAMACVLAQESLNYLSQDEYRELTETVLQDFDQQESDAIYAKALGYFDGLMFGIPAEDERQVNARLMEFVGSPACSMNRTVGLQL